jgi:alkaline phosphatase
MKKFLLLLILASSMLIAQQTIEKGNVIFIHPDGTGSASWNAARVLFVGPDGLLNWDKFTNIGLYRSHMKNSLGASSHSGATVHAYGVKVEQDSYGMDGTNPLTARSGKNKSIMHEAMEAGIRVGIVNTGNVIEPGSAVFVASSESRKNSEEITKKVIESGADLIFCGGEEWMLPEGVKGFHTDSGKRTDGINLIEKAAELGYVIIYNKEQLESLSREVKKVLGVFAANHTFNDKVEEELTERGLPLYQEQAPSFAEMVNAAITILSANGEQFFLVAEEEATDNFGNKNNAIGTLTAHKKADDAFGVAMEFIEYNPNTLLITASDSEASGMELIGYPEEYMPSDKVLPATDRNGAPIDGVNGSESLPFISAPDKNGNTFPFGIIWSSNSDLYGGVIAKSMGLNAHLMKLNFDNTDVYRMMYATLFGVYLD